MSRQFDFEKEMKNAPVTIKSGSDAIRALDGAGSGTIIGSRDKLFQITHRGNRYEVTAPSSKKDGGTYYLDSGITDIVGDFYKRGSVMSASVYERSQVERLVDYLNNERQEAVVAINNTERVKELLGQGGDRGAGNIANKADQLSAADKAVYGMVADGKQSTDILKFIASASRNPMNRQLAKLLLKTGIAPQVMAGQSDGWKFNAGNDKKYAAAYNPNTDTISLFRPAAAERNFLHEAMHAATLRALGKKGMAAGQMRALFNHVKKSGMLKGMYGMSDVDEFVAEAFTNPKFQEALKTIDAPASVSGLSSAWHWFVRVVRGILGLPSNQDSALSQAIEIGLGVMREDMAMRQQQVRGDFVQASPAERKDALMRMPEISIDDASLDGMDKAAIRAEVSRRFKAFKNDPVTALDGREVRFNGVGLREMRAHSADIRTMLLTNKAPELMRKAIPLFSKDHVPSGPNDSIKAWHYYGAKVVLNGKTLFARIVAREAINGSIYYDNDLTTVEDVNGRAGDAILTKTGAAAVSADKHSLVSWLASIKSKKARFNEAPEAADHDGLARIFLGLDARGLAKDKAEAALAERGDAERIKYIQDNFIDILAELEEAGAVQINCD